MSAPAIQSWVEDRLQDYLTGVELVSYERLEPGGDHVLMLLDTERGVGLVLHLPQSLVDDYECGQRASVERLFKFAGRELKTLAAEQLNAV